MYVWSFLFPNTQLTFLSTTELENPRTKMRSAVSVREGQGVVLLCGPPPRAGGKGPTGLHPAAGPGSLGADYPSGNVREDLQRARTKPHF